MDNLGEDHHLTKMIEKYVSKFKKVRTIKFIDINSFLKEIDKSRKRTEKKSNLMESNELKL